MQISFSTNLFCVIDNFLPSPEAEEVWKYLQAESYNQVTAMYWNGAWRLDDGPVMRGPLSGFGPIPNLEMKFPTGRGVDLVIQKLLSSASQWEAWIGQKDKDWNSFTSLPMLYPRDTSLFWHRDAANWTGSYTYYAHPSWNSQWGGELLVADESLLKIPEDHGVFLKPKRKIMGSDGDWSFGAHLDNSEASQLIMELGVGHYVLPKPNRLVLLKGGAVHCVTKVTAAAGDHVRASISGFFQRP